MVPDASAVESLLDRAASLVANADPLLLLAAGGGILAALVAGTVLLRRSGADARRSERAHARAREREPPVELGETYAFAVREFTDHHSGERVAVGKVEGFVLFAEDVPDGVGEGDVIRARVLSFNRGRTSADAAFVARE